MRKRWTVRGVFFLHRSYWTSIFQFMPDSAALLSMELLEYLSMPYPRCNILEILLFSSFLWGELKKWTKAFYLRLFYIWGFFFPQKFLLSKFLSSFDKIQWGYFHYFQLQLGWDPFNLTCCYTNSMTGSLKWWIDEKKISCFIEIQNLS